MNSSQLHQLQTAAKLLDLAADSSLAKDLATLADRSQRTGYQIAVFGPFNHGKSTLLNAILGSKALPIDLVPTTGAAIRVVYGTAIATKIELTDGQIIQAAGTEILEQFAVLDGDRRMRADVAAVEVSYPHPLLAMGVELLDLPGTNDREEQDRLVRDRLLQADLIVNVLDSRKLMTLGEREHLRDWLENRGIHTVVFVANFTNMLEPNDQREVQQRLRFVAESFRSDLPPGISNLHRVDALPALRARLKGDDSALHTSGLPGFLSALQSIVTHRQTNISAVPQPQLAVVDRQLRALLTAKISTLNTAIQEQSTKADREIELKKKAQQLMQTSWENSLQELEAWLRLPNLIAFYQASLAAATQQSLFPQWAATTIAPRLQQWQQELQDCTQQATDFFSLSAIAPLVLSLPEPPDVLLPTATTPAAPANTTDNITPTAIATGLGWLLGGPVGAAVAIGASTIVNRLDKDILASAETPPPTKASDDSEIWAAHQDAAADYLFRLNTLNADVIRDYRSRSATIFQTEIVSEYQISPAQQQQMAEFSQCLQDLAQFTD
jgi:GTPase SAR1 family protein